MSSSSSGRYHLLDPSFEVAYEKRHPGGKRDLLGVAHDIQSKKNPEGDNLDHFIHRRSEEALQAEENKKKNEEKKRETDEFFLDLSEAAMIDAVIIKTFIAEMEKITEEKKQELEQKIIQESRKEKNEGAVLNQELAQQQQQLQQQLQAQKQSIEQMEVMFKKEFKETEQLVKELDNLKLEDKFDAMLDDAIARKAIDWSPKLKEANEKIAGNVKAPSLLDVLQNSSNPKIAQFANSPEGKEKFKKLDDEFNARKLEYLNSRATHEEKLKHVQPLRDALQEVYNEERKKGLSSEASEKEARKKISEPRDAANSFIELYGAYKEFYEGAEKMLKEIDPDFTLKKSFGKSAMKLALDAAKENHQFVEDHMKKLIELIEKYNPNRAEAFENKYKQKTCLEQIQERIQNMGKISAKNPDMKAEFKKEFMLLMKRLSPTQGIVKEEEKTYELRGRRVQGG